MRSRWRAGVLAAAGTAVLLAGCGIRVSVEPSPSSRPGTAAVASPSPASPEASPSPSALPSGTPSPAGPPSVVPPATSSGTGETALAAAVRRVEAAARVNDGTAGVRPAHRRHGRAERRARRGRRGRRRRHGRLRALLRTAPGGQPRQGDEDTLFQLGAVSRSYTSTCSPRSPARESSAGTSRCAACGPASGCAIVGRRARRPSATSPRSAAACPPTPARNCCRSGMGAARSCDGSGIYGRRPASAPPGRRRTRSSPRRRPPRSAPPALRGRSSCARACSSRSATNRRYSAIAPTRPQRTRPRRTGSSLGRWCPRTRRTRRCSRRRSASAPASARSCRSRVCS